MEEAILGEENNHSPSKHHGKPIDKAEIDDIDDSESADPEVGDGEKIFRKDISSKDRTILGCMSPIVIAKGVWKLDYSNIVWKNVVMATVYHIAGLIGFYHLLFNAQWKTILFYCIYHVCCGLGVTAGMHRLWSHKSYRACTAMQVFLAYWATASAENSIFTWCRDHRVHHKYSETDADPHNAQRGLFFSHIGWLLKKKHPHVRSKGSDIDVSDLKRNKIINFQHKHYYMLLLVSGVLIPWLVPVIFWRENIVVAYFVMLARMMSTHHITWMVNSVAHWEGPTPYDKTIWPVENWIVAICALGEGWHNFHHAFPNDYRASDRYDGIKDIYLNLTRCFIDVCSKLGLCSNKIVAPESLINKIMAEYGDGYPEDSRYHQQRIKKQQ